MSMMVGNLNSNMNIFARAGELVSGSELEQVSQQLLSSAPSVKLAETESPKLNLFKADNGLKVFGAESNLDAQTVKNLSGYNVNLSNTAISAIEALKVQAAKAQAVNMPQVMDGRVYVKPEVSQFNDVKSVFSTSNRSVASTNNVKSSFVF